MERDSSLYSVYRQLYSYQASVNNNENTETNRYNSNVFSNNNVNTNSNTNNNIINSNNNMNNSYMISNHVFPEYDIRRRTSNENNNLIEILQNATDDSNNEETSNNDLNEDNSRFMDYQMFRDQSMLSNDYSSNFINDEVLETNSYIKQNGRALSAPTKPNNEAEEFKYSSQFINLDRVVQCSTGLKIGSDGKFDVDSEDASAAFKFFFSKLESLIKVRFFILLIYLFYLFILVCKGKDSR